MKHFDNSISVMGPENHSKNMANLKNLMSKVKFLFLIVAIFALNSCSRQLYSIKPTPKQDEISISPELRQFLNTNKQQISVVLRTPRTTSNASQEVQNGELYNTIERRLMDAGFVVRDRALLEKLIVNEQLSYESIAQKIEVDLIIEISENSIQDNIPTKMIRKKDNKEIFIETKDKLNCITSKFTFRIVLAEIGVSSGFFTYYYIPCTNGCDTYAAKYSGYYFFGNSNKEVRKRLWGSPLILYPREYNWWVENDFISKDLSDKISNILKGKY
jgi:uncharacterized lipoprotein YajG